MANVTLVTNTCTTVAAIDFVAKIEGKVISDDKIAPTIGKECEGTTDSFSPLAGSLDIYLTAPGADLSRAVASVKRRRHRSGCIED